MILMSSWVIGGGDDGTLNGSTPVTLIAAPALANMWRKVMSVTIQNRDTALVTITLRKVSAGGTRQLFAGDLDAGDTFIWDTPVYLDDTGSSITCVMSGAATTTNPDWSSSWEDAG